MNYTYKMVQIPTTIVMGEGKTSIGPGGKIIPAMKENAATFLEKLVNEHAKEGWEFFRIDPISVLTPAGCLASILGHSSSVVPYNVVSFRKQSS